MAFVFQASSGLFKRSSDKAGGMTGYKVFVLSTTLQVLDTDARAPLVVSAIHKGPFVRTRPHLSVHNSLDFADNRMLMIWRLSACPTSKMACSWFVM